MGWRYDSSMSTVRFKHAPFQEAAYMAVDKLGFVNPISHCRC
jgi:hypothetical protein